MSLARLARAAPRIQGLQAHQTHQALHTLAADPVATILEFITDPTAAEEGVLQVNLVDEAHQLQIPLAHWLGLAAGR